MFCHKCGFKIETEDAKFCPVCGTARDPSVVQGDEFPDMDPTVLIPGPPPDPDDLIVPTRAAVPPPGSPPPPPPMGGLGSMGSPEELPPWEERQSRGFWSGLVETVSAVLFQPSKLFRSMPVDRGLGAPLLFGIILASVGGIIGLIWAFMMDATLAPFIEDFTPGLLTFSALVALFLMPVFATIGLFINAGILHLSLMIVGGARRGFEATFRVIAYGSATDLFQVIPVLGGIIALIWKIVVFVNGLAETHRIGRGRAFVALLIPLVLCCGCVLAILLWAGLLAGLAESA